MHHGMALTRDSAVRSIASALVFSEPPAMANLTKARAAAEHVVDALVEIGALPAEPFAVAREPVAAAASSNGHAPADPDTLPAF
jgi:hypothetical protein